MCLVAKRDAHTTTLSRIIVDRFRISLVALCVAFYFLLYSASVLVSTLSVYLRARLCRQRRGVRVRYTFFTLAATPRHVYNSSYDDKDVLQDCLSFLFQPLSIPFSSSSCSCLLLLLFSLLEGRENSSFSSSLPPKVISDGEMQSLHTPRRLEFPSPMNVAL